MTNFGWILVGIACFALINLGIAFLKLRKIRRDLLKIPDTTQREEKLEKLIIEMQEEIDRLKKEK